jgi:hypothetical protein
MSYEYGMGANAIQNILLGSANTIVQADKDKQAAAAVLTRLGGPWTSAQLQAMPVVQLQQSYWALRSQDADTGMLDMSQSREDIRLHGLRPSQAAVNLGLAQAELIRRNLTPDPSLVPAGIVVPPPRTGATTPYSVIAATPTDPKTMSDARLRKGYLSAQGQLWGTPFRGERLTERAEKFNGLRGEILRRGLTATQVTIAWDRPVSGMTVAELTAEIQPLQDAIVIQAEDNAQSQTISEENRRLGIVVMESPRMQPPPYAARLAEVQAEITRRGSAPVTTIPPVTQIDIPLQNQTTVIKTDTGLVVMGLAVGGGVGYFVGKHMGKGEMTGAIVGALALGWLAMMYPTSVRFWA